MNLWVLVDGESVRDLLCPACEGDSPLHSRGDYPHRLIQGRQDPDAGGRVPHAAHQSARCGLLLLRAILVSNGARRDQVSRRSQRPTQKLGANLGHRAGPSFRSYPDKERDKRGKLLALGVGTLLIIGDASSGMLLQWLALAYELAGRPCGSSPRLLPRLIASQAFKLLRFGPCRFGEIWS